MWEFLSAHPVCGLAYLAMICLTVMVIAEHVSKFSSWSNEVDDRDELEKDGRAEGDDP